MTHLELKAFLAERRRQDNWIAFWGLLGVFYAMDCDPSTRPSRQGPLRQ